MIGGLGSAVCDVVCEEAPCLVKKIGVNDRYGYSGPGAELLKQFGLSAENIAAEAKKMLNK